MGDRCSLTITFLKKDAPAFEAVLGKNWDVNVSEETDYIRTVDIEAANYSLYEQRLALAKQKLCFLGSHGAGYEYPSMLFASHNGRFADIEASGGQPIVRVEKNGKASKQSIREVARFLKIDTAARRILRLSKS